MALPTILIAAETLERSSILQQSHQLTPSCRKKLANVELRHAPRKTINIAALFHWTADTIVKQIAAVSSNAQRRDAQQRTATHSTK